MNSFAHSLSHPLARRDTTDATRLDPIHTVIALLVALVVAMLISGTLVYNSMSTQIESLQTDRVVAQQQSVQRNAYHACVESHSIAAASKCRVAAATFAANDPETRAFDKAVAYIYAR
ncbi:MAG: hypothetical protein ACRDKE_03835 [Solirubrobacterales bacterium]